MRPGARRQPLYDQLVDILTEKIEQEYRPGDLMPSERELSERYGLSRTTVRLALQELERLGMVVRQHGRGTFVADRSAQATNLSQQYSFTEQMRSMGRVPETTILEFSEFDADKQLAERMGVRPGDRLFKLKRLRAADGVPMMVEKTYLPVRKFLTLKRPLLDSMPLYEIIESVYHEKIRLAEEEFFASVARTADAHLLGIAEGDPVLDLVRTTYNTSNEIIEYTLSVARADQFKYKVVHQRLP
ncbi:GntR family transcriptional regulator [Olsenella profusa]|uniref:GntR family transcriptional regulator n=1 Tax=Olsenella profusa TaxID=138595 RepID=A0ABS2F170_9ACTN|nr:GntR family transcriptional regulator [Olsenella profusa]MBM6774312.1 GntR family transcriptional regulator [Olsenella profusa]